MKKSEGLLTKFGKTIKHRGERGAILVTSAFAMIPLVGIAVLATDLGMAYLRIAEAQNINDLAGLAAIKNFSKQSTVDADSIAAVRTAAKIIVEQNKLRNGEEIPLFTGSLTASSDNGISFGFYDFEAKTFTPLSDTQLFSDDVLINAIRTRTIFEGADSFAFTLANLLRTCGMPVNLNFAAESIASFGLMNIVMAFDISGSMDDQTYRPIHSGGRLICKSLSNDFNRLYQRYFHVAARPDASPEACMAGDDYGKPIIGATDGDYGAVMPQPITDVFQTARDVLLETRLFKNLYRSGLIVYDTAAWVPNSSVLLTVDATGNKDDVSQVLTNALDRWQAFAQSGHDYSILQEIRSEAMSNPRVITPFPGGLCPDIPPDALEPCIGRDSYYIPPDWSYLSSDQRLACEMQKAMNVPLDNFCYQLKDISENPNADLLSSGFTNTGDAIYRATEQISVTNEAGGTRNTDVLILFSDGAPNAYRQLSPTDVPSAAMHNPVRYGLDAEDYVKGAEWGMMNAVLAAEHEIAIHAIYFSTDGAPCEAGTPGFDHMTAVAATTAHLGGSAYCATEIDCDHEGCLKWVFEQLGLQQSFVLVPSSATGEVPGTS